MTATTLSTSSGVSSPALERKSDQWDQFKGKTPRRMWITGAPPPDHGEGAERRRTRISKENIPLL